MAFQSWEQALQSLSDNVTVQEMDVAEFLNKLPQALLDTAAAETQQAISAAYQLLEVFVARGGNQLSNISWLGFYDSIASMPLSSLNPLEAALRRLMTALADTVKINNQLSTMKLINYWVPIFWVVTRNENAARIGLSGLEEAKLIQHFGWLASFAEAFYNGAEALSLWFKEHGFFHSLEFSSAGDAEAAHASRIVTDLSSAFHSISQAESPGSETQTRSSTLHHGIKQIFLDKTPSDGCEGGLHSQCVGLLVDIPTEASLKPAQRYFSIQASSGAGAASDTRVGYKPPSTVIGMGIHVPGTTPIAGGVQVTESRREVCYEPFIFTAPRVHFLLECAEVCAMDGRSGLRLSGVHGAGKSTVLRALVGILTVGAPTDAWFLQDARKLRHESAATFFFEQSTGQAICPCGVAGEGATEERAIEKGRPTVSGWLADFTKSSSKWEQAAATMSFFEHRLEGVPGAKVVVLDEVNKLISDRQRDELRFLRWDTNTHTGCLRILAASPDGPREGHIDGYVPFFFELRPAPASHLAAILVEAPEHVVPGLRIEGKLSLRKLHTVCNLFGSNMRYVAMAISLAHAMAQPSAADGDGVVLAQAVEDRLGQAAQQIFDSHVDLLAQRMVNSDTISVASGPLFTGLLDRCFPVVQDSLVHVPSFLRMNASLLMRENPQEPTGVGLLVGHLVYTVQLRALKLIKSHVRVGDALFVESQLAMAMLQLNTACGNTFEGDITSRLYLGALCRKAIPLPDLPRLAGLYKQPGAQFWSPAGRLGTSVEGTAMHQIAWRISDGAASLPTVVHCTQVHEVPSSVYEWIRDSRNGESLLIQTHHDFPYIDQIVVRNEGGLMRVLFVESTISTVYAHAKDKGSCSVRLQGAGQGAAAQAFDSRLVDVPPCLRDLAKLVDCATFLPLFDQETKVWKFRSTKSKRGHLSVANVWLHILGAPFRMRMYAYEAGGTTKFVVETVPTTASEPLEGPTWKTAILYVSGKKLGDEEHYGNFKHLECNFAYCAYAQHCDVVSQKNTSQPNTPREARK